MTTTLASYAPDTCNRHACCETSVGMTEQPFVSWYVIIFFIKLEKEPKGICLHKKLQGLQAGQLGQQNSP